MSTLETPHGQRPLDSLTTADLIDLVAAAQGIQKVSPPASLAWGVASIAINAIAPILAQRTNLPK